jgi:subtilisin-like proprotein convertase family protein
MVLELDITHSFVGDLEVVLEHDGLRATILEGMSLGDDIVVEGDHIYGTVDIATFYSMDLTGTWTLRVSDAFAPDEGTLDRWALVVIPR